MSQTARALIVDDDPDAIAVLEYLLEQRFPQLEIDTRTTPDPEGAYNLFFIDNDFRGHCLAGPLAAAIRRRNPEALIIAFSARLNVGTLKALLKAGCDGACDKSDQRDIDDMLQIVRRYLCREPEGGGDRDCSWSGTIRSITELLKEWNARIGGSVVPSNIPVPSQRAG